NQGDATSHCGKAPSRGHASAKKQAELMALRNRLERAVKDEDYESAAKLRDRIKEMENKG
ncbi:MAG TPA: UvrB/UvrC motif-containing protein, partial [Sedimentisphaerales bacterium]|nr:UvrB/UvrC motif-containing protein [Sedimentisphaerales bacterium]